MNETSEYTLTRTTHKNVRLCFEATGLDGTWVMTRAAVTTYVAWDYICDELAVVVGKAVGAHPDIVHNYLYARIRKQNE